MKYQIVDYGMNDRQEMPRTKRGRRRKMGKIKKEWKKLKEEFRKSGYTVGTSDGDHHLQCSV